MVRLCAKILTETELYDTDMEVRKPIDWICVSERMKALCKERNNLYEKQNDLKGQENRKSVGTIRNVEYGDCHALHFSDK